MKRTYCYSLLALALGSAMLLSACNKDKNETTPPMDQTPPASDSTADQDATTGQESMPGAQDATQGQGSMPAAATPVSVTSVTLGNRVDSTQNVTTSADSFSPKDTIYASVATSGTAQSAMLAAKWTYQDGQTVNESSQTIAPNGDAVTTFHIAKPDGWPTGNYKIEISLDGNMVQSKDFSVK